MSASEQKFPKKNLIFDKYFDNWLESLMNLNSEADNEVTEFIKKAIVIKKGDFENDKKEEIMIDFLSTLVEAKEKYTINYPKDISGNQITAEMLKNHFSNEDDKAVWKCGDINTSIPIQTVDLPKNNSIQMDDTYSSNQRLAVLDDPYQKSSVFDQMSSFALRHQTLIYGAIGFTVCLGIAAACVLTCGAAAGAFATAGAVVGLSAKTSCIAGVGLSGVAGGIAFAAAKEATGLAKSAFSAFTIFSQSNKTDTNDKIPAPLPGPVYEGC